jgi:hypothetical protein
VYAHAPSWGVLGPHAVAVCAVAIVAFMILVMCRRMGAQPLWSLTLGMLALTGLIVAHGAVLYLRQILEVWGTGSTIAELQPLPEGSAMFASAIQWGLLSAIAQVGATCYALRDRKDEEAPVEPVA